MGSYRHTNSAFLLGLTMKFYSVKYVPDYKFLGNTRGPFITIRADRRGDLGLLMHELEHVKQWYAVTIPTVVLLAFISPYIAPLAMVMWPTLYRIPLFRKWSEVFAFRKSIKYADDPENARKVCAVKLSTGYKLKLTYDEAMRLLK